MNTQGNKPKISFRKVWDREGYISNQCIRIDRKTYDILQNAVYSEIAMGQPQKDKYISTSGYEIFLEPLKCPENGVSFLNHTQTRFINLFLKLPLKDRNTRLIIK